MEELILPKNKRGEFIDKTLTEFQVFAPVDNEGIISFQRITTPSEFTLDFSNTKIPPKDILFPQTETLLTFTLGKEVKLETPSKNQTKTIILGIRPCDAKSFTILDHVFKDEYKDPYYLQKRENTILIGLSCTHPEVNCFCTSLNGPPSATEDVDIMLTDIGKKYYVEVVSKKGKKLIGSMADLFKSATKADKKRKTKIDSQAKAAIKRHINIEGVLDKLDEIFEDSLWKETAMKCLGCGICTYLCPTCYCFDIQDESTGSKGGRVRVWDSCMYSEFTLQAADLNPRPKRKDRLRNRIYHKFNYFPKNFDVTACVGCGRCIDACPVNIDVIELINRVKEVKE